MAISDQDKQTLTTQISSCTALSGGMKSRFLSHINKPDSSKSSFSSHVDEVYGYDKFTKACEVISTIQQNVNTISANTGIALPSDNVNFGSMGYQCPANSRHIAFKCINDVVHGGYVVTDQVIFDNRQCNMVSALVSFNNCAVWAQQDSDRSLTYDRNMPCSDFLGDNAFSDCIAGL